MPSLADLIRMGKQYIGDALPGGVLNQEVTNQSVLDGVSTALTPVPLVGDVAGLAADAYRYKTDPESRTPLNFGLSALGALPFVPSMAGVLRNAQLQGDAAKHFGTTSVPSETGFILDNGSRLDMSGRHYATGYQKKGDRFVPQPGQRDYLAGGRNVDHRELGDLVPGQQWDGLADFINQTGAVRYMPNVGISAVDTNMPNVMQVQRAVEDFRRSRTPMSVDVDTLSGSSRASQEFERPTVDAVMEWMKSQMKPEAFESRLKDLIGKE